MLLVAQLPIGSTFKDPGYYAISTALGTSNPVTVQSTIVPGVRQLPLSPESDSCTVLAMQVLLTEFTRYLTKHV